MTDVPHAAIGVAAATIRANLPKVTQAGAEHLAKLILEAASPHIIAAEERERGTSEMAARADEIHAEHHPGTFAPSLDSCTEHTRTEYEDLVRNLTTATGTNRTAER